MGAALHKLNGHPTVARRGRALRSLVLLLVLGGVIAPMAAGLAQVVLAAFGYYPALGATRLGLSAFRALAEMPGIFRAVLLSLGTGLMATALSFALSITMVAALLPRLGPARLGRLMAPILAAPHAAMAIGLGFLIAPSGWIVRLLSPWATGWDRPPDIALTHDPWGIALTLGLILKETPFLTLTLLSAVTYGRLSGAVRGGRALGYGGTRLWTRVLVPMIYPLVRLPVYAVLAYSVSVVDMALILGPTNPPTLSVLILRLFYDAETAMTLTASAAAVMQVLVVLAALLLWWTGERALSAILTARARWGDRGRSFPAGGWLAAVLIGFFLLAAFLSIMVLAIWSVAWRWPFPAALPESWSLRGWLATSGDLGGTAVSTVVLAMVAASLSVILAILWLEGEDEGQYDRARWAEWMIYLPLLLPQVGFLQGVHIAALRLGLPPGPVAVVWAQFLFVFPYVLVTLSDPWRNLDPHLVRAAAALGAGPFRRLVMVKIPCLTRPILTAFAVGFAVSVAQYMPTLFLGGGRVATLTTEAVSLASGGDRRITAVYAFLQAALPMIVYLAALILPALLLRNRRGLAGAAV